MTRHKYKIGNVVVLASKTTGTVQGEYKIVQQLPAQDQDNLFQYRVKSRHEPNERIVNESQIRSLASYRN